MKQHVCKLFISLSFKTFSLLNNGLELAFHLAEMMALMTFLAYEIDSDSGCGVPRSPNDITVLEIW